MPNLSPVATRRKVATAGTAASRLSEPAGASSPRESSPGVNGASTAPLPKRGDERLGERPHPGNGSSTSSAKSLGCKRPRRVCQRLELSPGGRTLFRSAIYLTFTTETACEAVERSASFRAVASPRQTQAPRWHLAQRTAPTPEGQQESAQRLRALRAAEAGSVPCPSAFVTSHRPAAGAARAASVWPSPGTRGPSDCQPRAREHRRLQGGPRLGQPVGGTS